MITPARTAHFKDYNPTFGVSYVTTNDKEDYTKRVSELKEQLKEDESPAMMCIHMPIQQDDEVSTDCPTSGDEAVDDDHVLSSMST